jgi:hypothetical protein
MVSAEHCQKIIENQRSHIQPNVKEGTGEASNLKEASEFDEETDSLDPISEASPRARFDQSSISAG